MIPKLQSALSVSKWIHLFSQKFNVYCINRGEELLDQQLCGVGPAQFRDGLATVIADGLWRNPNHFFRLRLFVSALANRERFCLLGILRSRNSRSEERSLRRIGFREFVYLDDDPEFRIENFMSESENLLSGILHHSEILDLELPNGLPAYIFYDTVLKITANPQPPINHPQWRLSLAELLCSVKIYEREYSNRNVAHVVLSHPWKTEWATLLWQALKKEVPSYHLTGFCEAIRIRRFRSPADYSTPVEHLTRAAFYDLAPTVQNWLVNFGSAALAKRADGSSTDINASLAYNPSRRIVDREKARVELSGQSAKPIAVIFSHVWYDFPHTFAMTHFTDFRDWIDSTIEKIRDIDDVVWLLKPHPTENWYGGFRLEDIATDLPSHIRILPLATETQTVLTAADAIVTVHGTVGIEAAAIGKAVLLADRSYYADWNFAHVASGRADYLEKLGCISALSQPDQKARDEASACFALALAEPPTEMEAMPMICDSQGAKIYPEISRLLNEPTILNAEIQQMSEFLNQSVFDSYASWRLIKMAQRATIHTGLHVESATSVLL